MMKTKVLLTMTVLIFLWSCASRNEVALPDSGELYGEWAHNYIEETVEALKMKGGINALVISEGETLYRNGVAYGNETTPMPVGSISKIFTALGIMTLIEEGELRLDTTLDSLIPEIHFEKGEERMITVKMLLTHTSGIQGVVQKEYYTMNYIDGNDYFRTIVDFMDRNPLICEPGKMFAYSNVGYDLLGVIIERVSGETFSDYIRAEVFDKAGMVDSLVYPGEREADLPLGYGLVKTPVNPPLIRDLPAGGMLISLRDMESFIFSLLDGKIIGKETLELMTTRQNGHMEIDETFSIGLCFWLENPLGTEDFIMGHGGDIPPFHSNLMIFPESRSAVFAATNDQIKSNSVAVEASYKLAEGMLQNRSGLDFSTLQTVSKKAKGLETETLEVEGIYPSALGVIELIENNEGLICKVGNMKLYSERKETGFWNLKFKLFGKIAVNIPGLDLLEYDAFLADGEKYVSIWMGGIYLGATKAIIPVTDMEDFSVNLGEYVAIGGKQDEYDIMPDSLEIRRDKTGVYYLDYKSFGSKASYILEPHSDVFADTAGEGRDLGQGLYFSADGEERLLSWTGIEFVRKES